MELEVETGLDRDDGGVGLDVAGLDEMGVGLGDAVDDETAAGIENGIGLGWAAVDVAEAG